MGEVYTPPNQGPSSLHTPARRRLTEGWDGDDGSLVFGTVGLRGGGEVAGSTVSLAGQLLVHPLHPTPTPLGKCAATNS